MNVTGEIERLKGQIKERQERIEWLEKHREKLEALPNGRFYDDNLDFDNLPHREVIKVVRTIGGKWNKSVIGNLKIGTANYETEIGGMKVRCWQGGLPPSCRIVEVDEYFPEQIIPAGVRKVFKTICHPELPAVIATAAEKGANETVQ